jgi:hypothetical protein
MCAMTGRLEQLANDFQDGAARVDDNCLHNHAGSCSMPF